MDCIIKRDKNNEIEAVYNSKGKQSLLWKALAMKLENKEEAAVVWEKLRNTKGVNDKYDEAQLLYGYYKSFLAPGKGNVGGYFLSTNPAFGDPYIVEGELIEVPILSNRIVEENLSDKIPDIIGGVNALIPGTGSKAYVAFKNVYDKNGNKVEFDEIGYDEEGGEKKTKELSRAISEILDRHKVNININSTNIKLLIRLLENFETGKDLPSNIGEIYFDVLKDSPAIKSIMGEILQFPHAQDLPENLRRDKKGLIIDLIQRLIRGEEIPGRNKRAQQWFKTAEKQARDILKDISSEEINSVYYRYLESLWGKKIVDKTRDDLVGKIRSSVLDNQYDNIGGAIFSYYRGIQTRPDFMDSIQFETMRNSVDSVLESIKDTQHSINPNVSPEIITNNRLGNHQVDLLVVFSDSSIGVYTWSEGEGVYDYLDSLRKLGISAIRKIQVIPHDNLIFPGTLGIQDLPVIEEEGYIGKLQRLERELKSKKGSEILVRRIREQKSQLAQIASLGMELDSIENMLGHMEFRLKLSPSSEQYITNKELDFYRMALDAYQVILLDIPQQVKNIPKLKKILEEKASKLMSGVVGGLKNLNLESRSRVYIMAEEAHIPGFGHKYRNRNWLEAMTATLSRADIPEHQLLREYLVDVDHKVLLGEKELYQDIQEQKEKVRSYAKSQGLSIRKVYEKIMNGNDMISLYNEDYYKNRGKQSWVKKNYHQTEELKALYEKEKTAYFKMVDAYYTSDEAGKKLKSEWIKNNTAWVGWNRFITLRDPSQHYSGEYKALDPKLKELYTFLFDKMHQFFIMSDTDEIGNKVAWIKKDLSDKLWDMKFKFGMKNLFKGILDSVSIRETDAEMARFKQIGDNNEIINRGIPKFFIRPITDAQGNILESEKSHDLMQSLYMFGRMAMHYHFANEVIDSINLIRENMLIGEGGSQLIEAQVPRREIESFDQYNGYYSYKHKVRNQLGTKVWGNREISMDRVLRQSNSFYRINKLAFNLLAIFGGAAAASAGMLALGAKRQNFSQKQFMGGFRDMFSKEAWRVLWWLEPFQEDVSKQREVNASANKMKKIFSSVNLMVMWKQVERFLDAWVGFSMMRNYGLRDGIAVKLSKLPPGTKSIRELFKDGKVEGMSEEGHKRFRLQIKEVAGQSKGNMSDEDMSRSRLYILYQLMFIFRNWLPAMFNEFVGRTRYNTVLDEMQAGRFRVMFGDFLSENFRGVPKKTAQFIGEYLVGFVPGVNANIYKINKIYARKKFDEYIGKNPMMQDRIDKGYVKEEELFQDWLEQRKGYIRANMSNLRMLAVLFAAMAFVGDDDDKKLKLLGKLLRKANLELAFFYSPGEPLKLLQSPIPVSTLFSDIIRGQANLLDEIRDYTVGENNPQEKTPLGFYLKKENPASSLIRLFEGK